MSSAASLFLRSRVPARAFSLALKPHQKAVGEELSSSASGLRSRISSPKRRISCFTRLPVELSCVMSMMPLHNAIASACLKSALSLESQNWGRVPQGMGLWLARKVMAGNAFQCLYDRLTARSLRCFTRKDAKPSPCVLSSETVSSFRVKVKKTFVFNF
ncbi:hypothetical protein Taro_023392 [Colocasia esculenta]|uniref:Uncharacterized protein n=1 Tax=Colocasia esculenta TaxID=4460 RepID=A0A843VB85_COLES|nr:hypothetical protein [Colocasia esculenta]